MTAGFGEFSIECPGHGRHAWQPPRTERRCCLNCGALASDHLDEATRARVEFFATLKAPKSCHATPKRER